VSASACRATERFKDPPPELLARSAPLPVTISSEVRGINARTSVVGNKTKFRVGKLLQSLFVSNDGRYFLSYVDDKIDLIRHDDAWRTEYTLVLALQLEGTYHLIQSQRQADSGESARASGREAIEACVEDVYQQVSALISASSRGALR